MVVHRLLAVGLHLIAEDPGVSHPAARRTGASLAAHDGRPAHARPAHAGLPSPTERNRPITMRDDYLQAAHLIIPDAMVLVNVVSRRVKQLRRGARALVVSLEKLSLEDVALREIIEGKISYTLGDDAD